MSGFETDLYSALKRFEDEINNIVSINYVVRDGWNDSKADELLQIISGIKADADNVIQAGQETVCLINRNL